ncbi:hypothetical protein IQ235_05875 [Oscillatoriales cyanobacterium LEGE 11467]|uniref:TPR repeat-containing protein n=1 Tax=Zarconia navalis LEGE 11467 TaxID=1828826 RepID=A0A928VZ36_9CYAN|nr:hypothetical protein [Zarconia navalis]MBE9040320.1 hypothetical protein [Zarconia navalis LEGE 11467]
MALKSEEIFNDAIERYQAGEDPSTLIPVFKDICDSARKNSSAWTCLAWLYLLDDRPLLAYKAARKAVKLNPDDPQARVNLAIASIESKQKGVREQIDRAIQLMMVSSEWRSEIQKNFEDGLNRKPDWKSLQRVQSWILEA